MKLSYDPKFYNSITYDNYEDAYELEVQYEEDDNLQTIWMQFGFVNYDRVEELVTTQWWNVALSIYDKRKDMFSNMDKKISTGKDLIRNVIIARKMFDALEAKIISIAVKRKKDTIIYVHWEDNRRRDAYYKVLSRKGYRYGNAPWGTKVIMKKFRWKDYKEMLE